LKRLKQQITVFEKTSFLQKNAKQHYFLKLLKHYTLLAPQPPPFQTVNQGFPATARGPNPAPAAISSGRKDILSIIKLYFEKFVDLAECNVSRNNHIT